MRRVTIGSNSGGRSFVASDQHLSAPSASAPFATIWDTDSTPHLPSDGTRGEVGLDFFPPPGGIRVVHFVLYPGSAQADADTGTSFREGESARAATIGKSLILEDGDSPGVHRTNTVDIELVLSGQVDLQVDTGVVTLRAGDWVVQNGTRHAWVNNTDQPCVLAAIFVGAHLA